MKAPLSWIRDFVDVPGTADEIGERMSLRGLALEGIERYGDDAVLDFDVTANRPDCLSIRGIAREIATAYALPLKETAGKKNDDPGFWAGFSRDVEEMTSSSPELANDAISVSIPDTDLCSRYVAAVADVKIGPSPDWMQKRLNAAGMRPISNIVDITNYVLIELGYPMHAFDHAKLAGSAIVVRRARPGERLRTLDGKDRALDPDMLVIADAERAQAIGGVMGGAESEVSGDTRRIVFEAAWFKPQSVRATSKRLGLRTEASYRFERGADLTATAAAMTRALELLQSIDAGCQVGPFVDCYPVPHSARMVTLDPQLAPRLLGMEVPDADGIRILESLGFQVQTLGAWQAAAPEAATPVGNIGQAWRLEVPGWRVDVARPVDIVEEIGRHHGFEHLPSTVPAVEEPPGPSDPRITRDASVRRALLASGFSEAVTFGFIEASAAEPFVTETPVTLTNPLSEKFTTMRPTLLPGLVDVVSHNQRHGRRDVRLFEIGGCFSIHGEARRAGAVWAGAATPEHWSGPRREVDFFDIKGVAERVCSVMDVTPEFVSLSSKFLVEGRAAELRVNGDAVGLIGQLHAAIAEQREMAGGDPVYVLELDLDRLSAHRSSGVRLVRPLPRHPAVSRDVSILIDDTLSAATVRGTIRAVGAATLVDIREFDRYQGKGIPEGKVSLSIRFTFQAPDRTLTDDEVNAAMQEIVRALTSELGAVQR